MRTILHVDMNSCYASIEAAENPSLRGKPVVVGGNQEDRHGIVLAKSEEAKRKGIRTAETLVEAFRKCPELIVVPPRYELYLDYSRRARTIYETYASQVEPYGLDECWLDVTGSFHLKGDGLTIAHDIRERMKRELKVTVSVGVSFNKVFAKLGSDMKKPDAVTEIPFDRFQELVWPLPVRALNGIGRATEAKLRDMNIQTLGDLAHAPPRQLKTALGVNGLRLWHYANGRDGRLVAEAGKRSPVKSIGRGVTCRQDLENATEVYHVLQQLSLEVAGKLKREGLEARGVELGIKETDFYQFTYRKQMPYATSSSMVLAEEAMALYRERYHGEKTIRALSLRAINLVEKGKGTQLDLFHGHQEFLKKEALDETIYQLRQRYGEGAVTFGGLTGDIKLPKHRSEICTLPTGDHTK